MHIIGTILGPRFGVLYYNGVTKHTNTDAIHLGIIDSYYCGLTNAQYYFKTQYYL